jgi:alkylation response protein AidB-like acyl-CoA dehydrogenase
MALGFGRCYPCKERLFSMERSQYEIFQTRVRDGLWELVAPMVERIEDEEAIPYRELWPRLRKIGAFGYLIPEEHGGSGLTISQYVPIIAEFAKVHGGIRALVHVHNSFAHAIADLATPEQRTELLPGAATGERSVAFALTEPDRGTGLDLGTTAVVDGGDYVINGRKWLITNSDFASHFIVLAKTGEVGSGAVLSAILVEAGAPGLVIEQLPETMGCKGGEHGQLTFTDVRVPLRNVLGGTPGEGERQLETALEISRLLVAASSLGTAQEALKLSLAHAQQRVTFGKALETRQAIQRYLAEMATDVYALQQMIKDAAAKWDAGVRIPAEAAACKLFGLEAVGRVTDRALLVHGGIGYTRRHQVERLYRDARLNWIEEGTPTIQYLTAARELIAGSPSGRFWMDA